MVVDALRSSYLYSLLCLSYETVNVTAPVNPPEDLTGLE